MPRTNTQIKPYETRDAFEADIDQIARLQLRREKLKAVRDIKTQKILDEFNPQISELDAQIEELQARAMPYAQLNRDRLFGKSKSASCSLATYGFKQGNKTLANVSGNSDEIIAKTLFDLNRQDCAIVIYKLNKEGIKKALKNGDELVGASFKIIQVERFFVEAKTDKENN